MVVEAAKGKEVAAEAVVAVEKIGRSLVKSHPAAVNEAVTRLLAVVPDKTRTPNILALQAIAQGKPSPRQLSLEKQLPVGAKIAAYMDCGPDMDVKSGSGVRLRVLRGTPYQWTDEPAGTVAYDGNSVVIAVSGLNPSRSYQLGFTWWDYDANGREESVWISGRKLVDKTVLPVWQGQNQGPATVAKAIPAASIKAGRIEIAFRREGKGNAVVSEVWIVETTGPVE